MNKMHQVFLTETQIVLLQNLDKNKSLSTNERARVKALKLLGRGMSDAKVATATERSIPTIERIRKSFALKGLEATIKRKKRRGRKPKLDEAAQELMLKFIREKPPTGYARWTGVLVKKKLIKMGVVTCIGLSTLHCYLRARNIKLHQKKTWCISTIDAKFMVQAKIVIETYKMPYNKANPVICFDEKSYELKSHVRKPIPVAPGKPMREDNEWKRHGTSNVFMLCEPLQGYRFVKITKRRTKKDFAKCMRHIVDRLYPQAQKITVVLDNLNTHTKEAIVERYGAIEGKRIADKLNFIKTPVHGSWLNMAEIELSALSNQSLARRIPHTKLLKKEVRAWNKDRNDSATPINWTYSIKELNELFEKITAQQM